MALKHILHTGMQVADLQQTVELYKSLGFEVTHEFDKPDPKGKVAIMQKGDTGYEFFHFEDESHPQVPFIRSHIAIYSDDLENDVQTLIDKGYKLVIPITEGVVLRYAFLQDPDRAFCYEIATEKN